MCTEAGDVAFATVFRRDWALPLLRACLHELSGVAAGQYIAGRVCNMVLQYLTQALAFSHTWKELKVTLPSLLPRCGMGGRRPGGRSQRLLQRALSGLQACSTLLNYACEVLS